MEIKSIFSMALSLFLLMDSFGNLPLYVSLLKGIPPKRQRMIILRELIIALFVIIAFYFIGNVLLELLHVSNYTVMISGGTILFLIALKMIFPVSKDYYMEMNHRKEEPFIVPLAIPLVAGPAVLAAVMIYSHEHGQTFEKLMAIVIAWIASTVVLISASFLQKVLGVRGITACEHLMGLVLTLISIQMLLEGFMIYISSLT